MTEHGAVFAANGQRLTMHVVREPDGVHLAHVDALTRAGRLDDARDAFEKMLTYANHVGLFSEEIAVTGEQIGNFPQAFTHLSMIDSAITLDQALDRQARDAGRTASG